MNEDQQDELDALRAIFEDDFTDVSPDPPCFMIKMTDVSSHVKGPLSLKVTFGSGYPDELPVVEIPMRSRILSETEHQDLIQHLVSVARENIGAAMVYTLVDEARQWLADNVKPEQDEEENFSLEEKLPASCLTDRISLKEPKAAGGRWNYVIGIVGKPSAGKSTFFNAATTLELAKTGAHPFTTIEPNIGRAFYSVPCPCAKWDHRCHAAHGHNHRGDRYVPVLLKDVAGLVPGACQGKGRGNRFLNDLLDADVLIHIIDISGCTDEKGEEALGYDPIKDVTWLRQELHQWIYDNVKSKWEAIQRRPQKLIDMFTGYHANQATIHLALQNAAVDVRDLSGLLSWKDEVLDNIVTEFLRLRFPMFLVLNKADKPSSRANIDRLQAQFDNQPSSLPVSSLSECTLQHMQRSGQLCYSFGSAELSPAQQLEPEQALQLERIQRHVLMQFGSTNVHQALCEAVSLRRPSYAFPVSDLETLTSIDKYRGEEPGQLRDCISLRPATTVEQLYSIMLHQPVQLLAGDFIRAECVDQDGRRRIARKEEPITDTNNIIKIFTNRKISLVKARE